MEPETLKVRTADELDLAVTCMGTSGSAVLLLHGLTSNRVSFDLDERHSLARELSKDFRVYILELRGHGQSQMPRPRRWAVDAYIEQDVPAVLDKIRALGNPKIHAVGHSMGGIILLSYLARLAEQGQAPKLTSLTTLGSSLFYRGTGSLHQKLLVLKPVGSWLPYLPMGKIKRLISPWIGRGENPIEGFYYNPLNMTRATKQKLFREGFEGVPPEALLQLATLFEEGGFTSWPHGRPYGPGLRRNKTPIHAVFGTLDKQCPPLAAESLRAAIDESVFYETVIEGYGHFDLLLGERAADETFPRIRQWILDRDRA